jgi:excisionase family DNA binding protein
MARTGKCVVKRSLQDGQALRDMATEQTERNCEVDTRSGAGSRIYNEEFRQPCGNKVLGVDQLAEFFNCSTEKIKRLARRGELPAFKFGKTWFVREQDLEAYITRATGPKLHTGKR